MERKRILCYGDSNTHGYNPTDGSRFPKEIRWTGRLQSLLGDSYEVVEEGCNGRTTMFGDETNWINGMLYLRPCLYSHRNIDYVILMLGTNDLKTEFGVSATEIGESVERLIKEIKRFLKEHQGYEPRIILVAPPVLGGNMEKSVFADSFSAESVEKSKELSLVYYALAKRNDCDFADASTFAPVSDEDSLHLSAESHAAFADEMYQYVITIKEK